MFVVIAMMLCYSFVGPSSYWTQHSQRFYEYHSSSSSRSTVVDGDDNREGGMV